MVGFICILVSEKDDPTQIIHTLEQPTQQAEQQTNLTLHVT